MAYFIIKASPSNLDILRELFLVVFWPIEPDRLLLSLPSDFLLFRLHALCGVCLLIGLAKDLLLLFGD